MVNEWDKQVEMFFLNRTEIRFSPELSSGLKVILSTFDVKQNMSIFKFLEYGIDVSPFWIRIIPSLKKWEKFILGAIDILSITLAFQCAYLLNYPEFWKILFSGRKIIKAVPSYNPVLAC